MRRGAGREGVGVWGSWETKRKERSSGRIKRKRQLITTNDLSN